MALYSEKVMDHFRNPRNVGVIENAGRRRRGRKPRLRRHHEDLFKIENDIVADVKFETFGCGSAIASSSMATN
jgi:nitrogen fixation NifU-like protein